VAGNIIPFTLTLCKVIDYKEKEKRGRLYFFGQIGFACRREGKRNIYNLRSEMELAILWWIRDTAKNMDREKRRWGDWEIGQFRILNMELQI
jgi:hypothetical protein